MRLSKPFIRTLENLVANPRYTSSERVETAGLVTRMFLSGNTKCRPRRVFLRALENIGYDANATADERMEARALLTRLFTSGLGQGKGKEPGVKQRVDTSGLSELLKDL